MKKTTLTIDKYEIENAMKGALQETSKMRTILQAGEINDATIQQLEDIKTEIIRTCTKAEEANLWYTTIHKNETPLYNQLINNSEDVVRSIEYRIEQLNNSELDNN